MTLKSLKILYSFLLLSFISLGQVNLNSPFSMFGLGNSNPDFNGQKFSMGSLGAAINDPYRVNINNPASLSFLENTSAEFSLTGSYNTYSDATASSESFNSHLGGFAMGFPMFKGLGMSIGLKPSYTTGYSITQSNQTNPLDSIRNEGTGGINDAFLGFGYKFKGLAIGAYGSYMFGNVSQLKSYIYDDESFQDLKVEDKIRFSNVILRYGLQYESPEVKSWKFVLGASYLPSQQIKVSQDRLAYNFINSFGRDIAQDTVFSEINNGEDEVSTYYSELSVGLCLKNDHFIIGGEYQQIDYSDFNIYGLGNNMNRGNQYKVGIQYSPLVSSERRDRNINTFGKRMVYRAGFRYKESPLFLNNSQVQEFGISFGVDLPVYTKYSPVNSYLNLGIELGRMGNVNVNNIEESFIKFNLTYTFNDVWFIQEKIN